MKDNKDKLSKPLTWLLQDNSFRTLFAEAQKLQRLQYLFVQTLNNELAQQCRVMQFQEGCLKLLVTSAVWAAHVRYASPMMIKSLSKIAEFNGLTSIVCKIDPTLNTQILPQTNNNAKLTAQDKQLIAETASFVRDETLREILLKLAK